MSYEIRNKTLEMLLLTKSSYEEFYNKNESSFNYLMSILGEYISGFPKEIRDKAKIDFANKLNNIDEDIDFSPYKEDEIEPFKIIYLSFILLDIAKNDEEKEKKSIEMIYNMEKLIDEEIAKFDDKMKDDMKHTIVEKYYKEQKEEILRDIKKNI